MVLGGPRLIVMFDAQLAAFDPVGPAAPIRWPFLAQLQSHGRIKDCNGPSSSFHLLTPS